ncbi:MAG: hypothetical protein JXQ75_15460 [Phycisphaerae bacterium]|nr:hypothetical protein [Phycisphaerae bacterium]
MPMDTLVFNTRKLARMTARLGLLRGEIAKKAGLSHVPVCSAFRGRPIGVRAARSIAGALGIPLADLLADEADVVRSRGSTRINQSNSVRSR